MRKVFGTFEKRAPVYRFPENINCASPSPPCPPPQIITIVKKKNENNLNFTLFPGETICEKLFENGWNCSGKLYREI